MSGELNAAAQAAPPIVAVVVLYKMRVADSATYRSLMEIFAAEPGLRAAFDLHLFDNSPEADAALPAGLVGTYTHDGANAGLAPRYEQALQLAQAQGSPWLLLFDQDTTLNAAYVRELVELAAALAPAAAPQPATHVNAAQVAAAVPRLEVNGRLYSPHVPRFRHSPLTIASGLHGVLPELVWAYNSGALMRVAALSAMGGFPQAYWLDFLDHAVFTGLQAAGGRVYLMRATLEHDLSEVNADTPATYGRTENRMRAEHRFYREYGTARDRLMHRLDLLRQVVGHARRGRGRAAWQRVRFLFRGRGA